MNLKSFVSLWFSQTFLVLSASSSSLILLLPFTLFRSFLLFPFLQLQQLFTIHIVLDSYMQVVKGKCKTLSNPT